MNPDLVWYLIAAGSVLAVAAFLLGRTTGGGVARRRQLELQLAHSNEERSRIESEAAVLREQLKAAHDEHDQYRMNVVDHFSGTSDLLRELTVQYRSVYEHLTKGASKLCPEGFVGLTEGLPTPQLAGPAPDLELEADGGIFEQEEPDESRRESDPATRPLSV
jgi:uncharacterized membrane-anchored protein YhcB (DUF1043 family)